MSEMIVRIIEDCRKVEKPATGLLGVYEGDFPRTVIVRNSDGSLSEFWFEAWTRTGGSSTIPERKRGEPDPGGAYFFIVNNPRIRLADGSHIWGDECWWSQQTSETLEKLQLEVDAFRDVYAAMLAAEYKTSTDADPS